MAERKDCNKVSAASAEHFFFLLGPGRVNNEGFVHGVYEGEKNISVQCRVLHGGEKKVLGYLEQLPSKVINTGDIERVSLRWWFRVELSICMIRYHFIRFSCRNLLLRRLRILVSDSGYDDKYYGIPTGVRQDIVFLGFMSMKWQHLS